MLKSLHERNKLQLLIGLLIGVIFGFLLQKGGVTDYDVILGQLLLRDFTVVKIMLTAVIIGMIGIYVMKGFGLVRLHPKPCYLLAVTGGGLIFGIGFGLLGYCPGTAAGAVGTGSIHALFGVIGMMLGTEILAITYPEVKPLLMKGDCGDVTIPELLNVNPWTIIMSILIAFLLYLQ